MWWFAFEYTSISLVDIHQGISISSWFDTYPDWSDWSYCHCSTLGCTANMRMRAGFLPSVFYLIFLYHYVTIALAAEGALTMVGNVRMKGTSLKKDSKGRGALVHHLIFNGNRCGSFSNNNYFELLYCRAACQWSCVYFYILHIFICPSLHLSIYLFIYLAMYFQNI